MTFISILKTAIIGIGAFISSIFSPQMGAIVTPIASFETSLSSRLTSSATTTAFASMTTDDGTSLVAGTTYGFVIDADTASEEYIIGTASTTSIINLSRGVSVVTGETEITALKKEHRKGASVKITDAPVLLQLVRALNGIKGVSSPLFYESLNTFSSSTQLVDKNYVDVNSVSSSTKSVDGTFAANSDNLIPSQKAAKTYIDTLDAQNVKLTGDQSIGGTKTFTSSPQVPSPDSASDAVSKDYVDAAIVSGGVAASTSTLGISKLSYAASSSTNPISVGDNDPRIMGITSTSSAANPLADKQYVDTMAGGVFGGNGSDGALSITSGTTTINLANQRIVTKNYSSISITGTGSLAFSNPHVKGSLIVLKSSGNVTITSSIVPAIDLRLIGAATTTDPISLLGVVTSGGSATTVPAGIAGTTTAIRYGNSFFKNIPPFVIGGAGGDGGGTSGGTVLGINPGKRGGGAIVIECAGALNITSTIDASGVSAAGTDNGTGGGQGGTGGSGGGSIFILYGSLVANSGTYKTNGASGGAGGIGLGGSYTSGGGGGGGASLTAGTAGTAGQTGTNVNGGNGGNGGNGFYLVEQY